MENYLEQALKFKNIDNEQYIYFLKLAAEGNNIEAQMILGIFPGINIPPEIIKLISKNFKVRSSMAGVTSIAAKVALSSTADKELIQYSQPADK